MRNPDEAGGDSTLAAARDAMTLGSSLALTGVLALIMRMLVPRFLGPAAFGEFRLAEATAELLFVVLSFGVDAQMRREAALDPARARAYLSGLTLLRLGAGAVGLAVAALFLRATGSGPGVLWLFALLGAAQVLMVLNNSYAAYEHAAGDVGWIARLNVGTKSAWAAAMLGVLALAPWGAAVAAVSVAVEGLRFAWLTVRGLRRHHIIARPDIRLASVAVLGSAPFFVNTLAHSLYARIGTGWVAAVTTDVEVGLYGAAGNLASIALLGMPILSWVLVPSAARAASRSTGEAARLVSSALRVCLLVMVPVALLVFAAAPAGLRLIYGEAYLPAAPVLRILAPTFALAYASTICAIALIQQGRIWSVAGVSIAGVGLTLALDMVLVPWGARSLGQAGGAQGAAWATLATEAFVTVALGWLIRPVWRAGALRRTAVAIATGVAGAGAAYAVVPGGGLLPAALCVLVFAALVVAARGIDAGDLRFLRVAVRRSSSPVPVPATVEVS